ncbi:unnamed protein product [Linum trigynum]|uniref:CCHC-type domain-containing protein n=1 Tax=Linum trigynum TaxID=586398 RepID=A0AAV2CGW3_9ROSI
MLFMPKLSKAYQLVLNDYDQCRIAAGNCPTPEAGAFFTMDDPRRGADEKPKCIQCGKQGHLKKRCFNLICWPEKSGSKNDKIGHKKEPCDRPHNGPKAAHVSIGESPIPGLSFQ